MRWGRQREGTFAGFGRTMDPGVTGRAGRNVLPWNAFVREEHPF